MGLTIQNCLCIYQTMGSNVPVSYHQATCRYQRRMRACPSPSESAFLQILAKAMGHPVKLSKFMSTRNRQLKRVGIIQQKIFQFRTLDGKGKTYIVDFYIPRYRLVLEIDGQEHLSRYKQAADATRTRLLASRGVTVIRIPNSEAADKHKANTIIDKILARADLSDYKQQTPQVISTPRDVELAMIASYTANHPGHRNSRDPGNRGRSRHAALDERIKSRHGSQGTQGRRSHDTAAWACI